MSNLKKEYLIISILPTFMIVYALILASPVEIYRGMVEILRSNSILVADYFVIGGVAASLFNAALTSFITIYILYKMQLKLSGLLVSSIMIVCSFSFMGKNVVNILPFYLGIYVYSKIYNKSLKSVIATGIMATTLAPLVSSLGIYGYVAGFFIGFIMPVITQNTLHFHHGYSLYNTGLAGGLIGILIYSLLNAFGFNFNTNDLYYKNFDINIFIFFLVYYILLMLIAIANDKHILKNLSSIYKHSGRLVTDFIQKEGFYSSIFNMGALGIFCLLISYYYNTLNGPVICGMLTVVAFGGFGVHLKNSLPLFIGIMIAEIIFKVHIAKTIFVMSIFFASTLSPISGKFGIVTGIIIGIIQYSLAIRIGFVHGGFNLYNNGLAAGIVASVCVPILENIKGGVASVRTKKKIAKMLDEIFRYFIEKNANNISMEYEDKKDKYEVICKSSLSVTDEEIEYLLSKYVKHQGLEYDMYWELMGEDSDEDELELLFMLADDVRIYYENNILEIIVEIKK